MGGFPTTQNEPQGLWRLGLGAAGSRPRTRELPGGPRPLRWKPLASGVKRKRGAEGRRGDTDGRKCPLESVGGEDEDKRLFEIGPASGKTVKPELSASPNTERELPCS